MRRGSNPERGTYTASPSSTSRFPGRRNTQVPLRAPTRQSVDATAYGNLTSGGGARSTDHRYVLNKVSKLPGYEHSSEVE